MKSCLNCKERHPACHDNCDDYKKLKYEREVIKTNYKQYMDIIGFDSSFKNRRFEMKRGNL